MTLLPYKDIPEIPVSGFLPSDFKINFRGILKEELHECWDLIQKDLNHALLYSPEENICSGDVYFALKSDPNTHLYIAEDFDGTYIGFFICQFFFEYHQKICHIWLLGSSEKSKFLEFGKMIVNVSRHNKCSKIRASTTRKGLGKVLERFGMREKMVTYQLEL